MEPPGAAAARLLHVLGTSIRQPERVHALRTLLSLVLDREPGLLGTFAVPLLALAGDADPECRRLVASSLADVVRVNAAWMPRCLDAALQLIRDTSAVVIKQALLSAAPLFRAAIVRASQQLGSNPELVAGWGAARALCASACLLVRAESEGVRLQALKFLEAAVLLHTAALGAHADEAGVAEGVCPTQPNSFLSASELNRDLRTYLDELQACTARPHAGPFSVVLVSVLANLSRLRPPLCSETLPPLLQLAASLAAAASNAQTASVSHAIKMSGVHLLRSGVHPEWRDRTVAALAALGHEEAAASAMRQAERSMKRERSQVVERDANAPDIDDDTSFFPEAKRARAEPSAPPTADAALIQQIVVSVAKLAAGGDFATLHAFIAQLSPGVLADVVLDNMRFLPPNPPPETGTAAAGGSLLDLLRPSAAPALAAAEPQEGAAVEAPGVQPAPAVAVALSVDECAAQRRAALGRLLSVESRSLATGAHALRAVLLPRVLEALADEASNVSFLKYVGDDYGGREGHALIVQWLYCHHASVLRGRAGGEQAYERSLLDSVRMLHSCLPARDRALPLLCVEAPVLPSTLLGELELLCGLSQAPSAQDDLEMRTLGLVALRDIVMNRAQEREASLSLILRCTVHVDDALRSKAIRMVVNQLHPLVYAAASIEQFAGELLLGACQAGTTVEADEALRCISLFFALCTRVSHLIPRLFVSFATACEGARTAFCRNMAGLARTVGPQDALLAAIEHPPAGSESLALLAFQSLTETRASVTPAVLTVGRRAYERQSTIRYLLPCLHTLAREEVRALLPQILALPSEEVTAALRSLTEAQPSAQPLLSASDLVVAVHNLQPSKPGLSLKKIADASSLLFSPQLRDVFTPDALAVSLGQLVEQNPVPLLFMRSVIQTAGVAPKLHPFIIETLVKLVLKQVWKTDGKTWEGVLRCAKQLVPRSFSVYLQLPAPQLREALAQSPDLAAPLCAYANTDAVRPRVAAVTLEVLAEATGRGSGPEEAGS